MQHPRSPTLFPYTTLFRSNAVYEGKVPAAKAHTTVAKRSRNVPSVARIKRALAKLAKHALLSSAIPSDVAGGDRAAEERVLGRSEEHTSELQSHSDLVCRL